jgi:cobalamin-dependent methionine synthase I
MEEVKNEALGIMKVRAVWQFFEAEADGQTIHVFAPGAKEPLHSWGFKRQKSGDQLCLSDYVLEPQNGRRDHIALLVVSAGEGIRARAEEAKQRGKSHGLQALALESAEACAEWLHRRIREDWGFPDPPGNDHGAAICFAVSREAVQLRVSGLPGSRRPSSNLEGAAAGTDWRAINRGLHAGEVQDYL